MSQTYTAVIKQAGSWWIAWVEEAPGVNCQERTREELLETLRITLAEALELSRRHAAALTRTPVVLGLDPRTHVCHPAISS